MDIFNNREIAIGLWLLAISIYIFLSSKMAEVRVSVRGLLSTFFVKQIMTVLGLMITYMAIVVYALAEIDLWNVEQVKNTVFWCVSVGFMSLFKLESIKKDKSFFMHSVIDNLKLLAVLQFIVGVYAFSLWIEVLLVPILAVIGAMLVIAGTDKKYHQVKVILEYCLSLFVIILVIYTLYMLVTNYGEFGQEKTVYNFVVPPLLTLSYLPFIFVMLVYSTYEQAFIRVKFSIENRFHQYLAKLYALVLFNVRMSLIDRWSYHVARENIESHADLIETFKYIYKVRSAEKNPQEISSARGWSPYKAKNFLSSEGFDTGFYKRSFEEEWFASSSMIEFGEGILPDNIAYYVEGAEEVVNTLKLKVNVNDAVRSEMAQRKLIDLAEVLSLSSLKQGLSEEMKKAILQGEQYSEQYGNKKITLAVENWVDHRLNGYDLKFVISSTPNLQQ
ncbi:MAG: hypothetical protein KUG72_02265 [Pseudomonadales bacterium]|nr:hypothetical protein [Pseudomonadales bacterium]